MNEKYFCAYAEWAETELVWGKGQYNWRRTFENPLPEDEEEMKQYDGLFGFNHRKGKNETTNSR